jgi:hypothetical protein
MTSIREVSGAIALALAMSITVFADVAKRSDLKSKPLSKGGVAAIQLHYNVTTPSTGGGTSTARDIAQGVTISVDLPESYQGSAVIAQLANQSEKGDQSWFPAEGGLRLTQTGCGGRYLPGKCHFFGTFATPREHQLVVQVRSEGRITSYKQFLKLSVNGEVAEDPENEARGSFQIDMSH